jgi:integrase
VRCQRTLPTLRWLRGSNLSAPCAARRLATSDISAILSAADAETGLRGLRDQAMLRTLLYTGLRRSEVVSMDWSLIHHEAGHVVLELPVTKSGVPQSVKLSPVVVSALDRYRTALDTAGVDCDAVWISLTRNKGQRISRRHCIPHCPALRRYAGYPYDPP